MIMAKYRAIPQGFMTVGEVAKKMGVTVRTLQYYDKEGLLSPSAGKRRRTQALYRQRFGHASSDYIFEITGVFFGRHKAAADFFRDTG